MPTKKQVKIPTSLCFCFLQVSFVIEVFPNCYETDFYIFFQSDKVGLETLTCQ